jgi:antitoxin component YwqK of YwqJK toxin-antitoxin module
MEYKVKVEGLKETWYLNEQKVKEIKYYENGNKSYEYYYLNGESHRENGPAYQYWYENGNKRYEYYYLNGKRHRENGPAYQYWYKNGNKRYEIYYLNGKYHRENGASYQWWYENGNKMYERYYLNGIEVTKEEAMKQSKTINIGGKEVSEDTILMALKEYFK